MQNLPAYIYIAFITAALSTVYFLYRASAGKPLVLVIALLWLIVQSILAVRGFYRDVNGLPPHFALAIMPPFVMIAVLFIMPAGRQFISGFNTTWLTWLHTVRIPVEFGLYSLFIYKAVPVAMTFEGHNFDILSGLSAPFIAYFGYHKKQIGKIWLLLWNFICLGLLVNIVITAILSAPFRFQHLGFEQPNIAILYFPFVWLPCFIVPVVAFAHFVSIQELLVVEDN